MNDSSASQVAQELRELARQVDDLAREIYVEMNTHAGITPVEAEVDSALSGVVERFEAMLHPNPEDLAMLAEPFKDISRALGTQPHQHGDDDLGMIDIAKELVGQWDGELRDNFVGNYLDPLSATMANQGKVAAFLATNAETMELMHRDRRQDAMTIARETLTALEAITVAGGARLSVTLSAPIEVGSAQTVLETLVTPEGAAEADGMVGDASGGSGGEAPMVTLGADTVEGVLDNTRQALDRVDERATDNESQVRSELLRAAALAGVLLGAESPRSTSLVPSRPALHDASRSQIATGLVRYAE